MIACLTLPACITTSRTIDASTASPPITEIPYRIEAGGWIVAPVMVNGAGPYDFIVDSAATRSAVYQRLADEQAFSPASRPDLRVLGLTETRFLPAWEIGDINVGGVVMENHIGVVLDDWPEPLNTPHGVLGLDFLQSHVIRFDVERQVIQIYPSGAFGGGREFGAASMRLRAHRDADEAPLYISTLTFKNRDIECIVDTGSALSVLNAPALSAMTTGVLVESAPRRGLGTGSRLSDVFGSIESAGAVRIHRISLRRTRWSRKTLVVFSAAIFRELGVDRLPYCILGADILAEQSFILDFPGERIIIER